MDKPWFIEDIETTFPLVVKGQGELSVPQLKTAAESIKQGGSLLVEVGKHTVEVINQGESVEIILNGTLSEKLSGPVHLDFNPMAVCIGSKCMRWPLPKTNEPEEKKPVITDEQFLQSVKGKLGPEDFERLQGLLSVQKKKSTNHQLFQPQIMTKDKWETVLSQAGAKGIVVDCSAVWCEPCHKIAPTFEALSKQFASKLEFYGVDVQVNTYVATKYKVESLPSFLFIKNGELVSVYVGSDEKELTQRITAFSEGSVTAEADVKMDVERATHYDYIVIGGGSGGMASAKEAAKHGANVAIFDYVKPSTQKTRWGLGGTCVNVGCVPKKLMHYAALCGEQFHDARHFGWEVPENVKHNWGELVMGVQNHVKKLNFFYEKGLASANTKTMRSGETISVSQGSVTYYNALAHFTGPNEVSYADDFGAQGKITGDKILIAVGGRPWVPTTEEVPGAKELAITSDDLFSLKKSPGKTLCVGAGYIALECGGFLTHLGLDVTLSVRSVPLRTGGFDRQAVAKVVDLMKATGTRFALGTIPTKLEKTADGRINVTLQNVSTKATTVEVYDTVLYATGRGADTQKLNIAVAGVKASERGTILTNDHDQTNVPHIFAIGDVADGRPELTPVAIQAGEMLARRLFAGATQLMDYTNVPTAVFTPFEYGMVGLSEEAAVAKYGVDDVEVFLSEFSSLEIGAAHRVTHGNSAEPEELPTNALSKLVCIKSLKNRVVGFHYVGPNAGEITQGFALGIRLHATKQDFDDLVGIHPTDAESFCALGVSKLTGEEWESKGGCGGGKCG